ncbi:MAG: hypothetical protein ACI4A3_11770 [Lachnospiraceae bacterium]
MVYENNLPPVGKGITVLFDINDSIKTLVCNMLEKESVEDKYLYLVGVDTLQFGLYYRDVCKECEDINQLFYSSGDINNGIVCPKVMFLFDNMNSCKNFKDFFEKIDDPVEKVQNELAYSSTDNIAMTLSIYNPIS